MMDMSNNTNKQSSIVTFNCKNIKRSMNCVRELCRRADIVALQETWLFPDNLAFLGTIDENFEYVATSAIDTTAGPVRGRPYGGCAILYRRTAFEKVSVI